jgi:hypothetical protein
LPDSPLACLDALAGEPVETACERAVFASPLSVAVAVSYAAARLRLLADGIAFARRADASYEAALADLRLAAQNDAYGIYAHVLATRDGCTAERCAAFALLHDTTTLKIHLRQKLYATHVAMHSDRWGVPGRSLAPTPVPSIAAAAQFSAMASIPAPGETPARSPVTTATVSPGVDTLAEAPPPLPKARPTAMAARSEAEDVPVAAPITPVEPSAAVEAPPVRRGLVPPSASALPNISFPSSASIPAINIMAPEPKLPQAETAPAPPAAPSTAPRRSTPQQ